MLTRQEQIALGLIIFLLLTGWAVKSWRIYNGEKTNLDKVIHKLSENE